ncbi:MAG TPA: nicotinamide-nucleotide amidohydrolase family protein [Xanthobacteraceae bacterium]
MIDAEVTARARQVVESCVARGLMIATAESCTGGLVAAAITEIPGSSGALACGFVAYSNAAKERMLGVANEILRRDGAVSRACAEAMAEGALKNSSADLAVAITGIAGPSGGSPEKPVGLVHFAAADRAGRRCHREDRFGDIGRTEIRRRSVLIALAMVEELATRA